MSHSLTQNMPDTVRRQLTQPPTLPSPDPTVSSWQEPRHSRVAKAQSHFLPHETDIVIIGSGVTGCGAAHTLLNHPHASNLSLTMLEARDAVSGATGRNGGHLVSDAAEMISSLVAQYGKEEAIKVVRFSEANIARLREIASSLGAAASEAAELRTVIATTGFKDEETLAEAAEAIKLLDELVPDAEIKHKIISAAEGIEVSTVLQPFGGTRS
ncbi:hypothetical protein ACHAQA_004547 [Verticillium albo-atrum]